MSTKASVVSLYAALMTAMKANARHTDFDLAHYLGSTHIVYCLPMGILLTFANTFKKENVAIPQRIYTNLLGRLYSGKSLEEKILASLIARKYPQLLSALPANILDTWISKLTGWAEVDTFSNVVDLWLRSDPDPRIGLLKQWNTDVRLEKRRASLVVLCSSVRHDPDDFWMKQSFLYIDTLKHEKHVMITKAISWLLRALIKHHKPEVKKYLSKNRDVLPKIAVREVTRKLETGRK